MSGRARLSTDSERNQTRLLDPARYSTVRVN
jgi:hypothetical protein